MAGRHEEAEIVLVSMPFGPLAMPSIGLELLAGLIPDHRVRVLYLTLPFGRRIGAELYGAICNRLFFEKPLIGEWLFSGALHEDHDTGGFLDPDMPETESLMRASNEVPAFLDACQRRVERHRPRLVGFTSTFQQHVASLALAERLKAADPELTVVFGGANCEGPMGLETVRRFSFVDAIVSGEAEAVFPTLVDRIFEGESYDDLQGVYSRDNLDTLDAERPPNAPRVPDLDALPPPCYDDFFAQWHEAALETDEAPRLLFETSRGCWWGEREHCTFCGLNGTSMTFRSKSAERALDELAELAARYPGHRAMVVDNILDMRYFRDFIPTLAKQRLDVELFYEVKANLTKDQVRLLAAAGIREVQPGIESLSDEVLKLMGKGVRGLQNVQLLKWCSQFGVWPLWFMLWGFPGEPAEEYRRVAEWVPWLTHLPPPAAANRIQVHRFSPNFERAEEKGLTGVEPYPAYRQVYPLPDEAITNLAYVFSFRYQEEQDVDVYTRELAGRIADWQTCFGTGGLFYTEQGEQLWLWDQRPAARRELTFLSGPAKDLYLACDSVRSIARLAGRDGTREQVEDVIAPLVEDGLMLRAGDRVLSLAIAGKTSEPARS